MGRKPHYQNRHLSIINGKNLKEIENDYELIIDGGSKRWLQQKTKELEDVWREVVRMNQLTNVTLGFSQKNVMFLFQNQNVTVNVENMFVEKD